MSVAVLISISFSLGFFVESIVGFGGGLIAYAILGFFMDLKQMILSGLYIGTLSSACIAYTDHKSFDGKILKSIAPLSLVGTVIGVFIFTKLPEEILAPIFGVLLILLAIKTIFFSNFFFPRIFKQQLILLGGISQGAFGLGGPFTVNAVKQDFKNKSNLRTTMAIFFVIFNLVRITQLFLEGEIKADFFTKIWWAVIPVFATIYLGYRVHLKVSEDIFKKLIGLMTIFAGLKFLSKVF